ncbi:MAG1 [Candida theae]|uniref:MAG1 n=1 Tax=Candida theae TaxID=1198502 RepID=A0AAD5FX82_9ASCO|nr:MAG1 [Candida theae]KAI5953731.1 MAG1 [Candida theae]
MGPITRANKSGLKTAENTSQVYPLATDIPTDININKTKAKSRSTSKSNGNAKSNGVSKTKTKPKTKPPLVKVPKAPSNPTRLFDDQTEVVAQQDNLVVPSDLSLPQEFIDYHTPGFIEGIKYCIEVDPTLHPIIVRENFTGFGSKSFDEKLNQADDDRIHLFWYSLVRSVIAQQVSGASAKSVEAKFKNLFNSGEGTSNGGVEVVPTAKATLGFTEEQLKSAGLSRQKVAYVQHISQVFADPSDKLTSLDFYRNASVDEIYTEVCKLKGIGLWSAKMFAIFTLEEMDVFAEDDLGVARGMAKYLEQRPHVLQSAKLEVSQNETKQAGLKKRSKFFNKSDSKRTWKPIHDVYVLHVAEKFKPFRSAFMMVLWRLSSTNIDVLDKD